MELFVAVALPGEDRDALVVDVRLDLDETTTVSEIAEALADAFVVSARGFRRPLRLVLGRTGALLDDDATVRSIGFVHGDELALVHDDDRATVTRSAPSCTAPTATVALDIMSGPDAGRFVMVGPGQFPIGRDQRAAIQLSDSAVERHHANLSVSRSGAVYVEPVGTFGTVTDLTVNQIPVTASTSICSTDVMRVGGTSFSVRSALDAVAGVADHLGQIPFHRTPYRPVELTTRTIGPIDDIPTPDHKRRFSMAAVLAPLVSGVGLAVMSGRKQFLVLAALAPLIAVYQWFDDRRHGGRSFQRQSSEFLVRVKRAHDGVDAALVAEQIERRSQTADLGELHRRARLRSRRLWERDRSAPDFLHVRVGLGTVASKVSAAVGTHGDANLREQAGQALGHHHLVHDVPVVVALAEVRAIGLWGHDEAVVEALAAAFVQQIVTLHSPEDVVVVAAVHSDRLDALEWTKWVPHTRSSTSPLTGCHLTTTASAAEAILNQVIALGGSRLSESWPMVVVLVDEQIGVSPALVAQLLDLPDTVGVSVLWIGDQEARVPRQCRAVIECGPKGSGRLWFTDPTRAAVDVILETPTPDGTRRVGMALAPVRDASTASTTTALPRLATLFDVLGVATIGADTVQRWWSRTCDDSLVAPVGFSATGTFEIDLVNQGPHALIAGTSGSGKSELLQTLVISLAMHHPPERLTFLFVDYKGGASSADFADLPHTVGAVTNLGADLARRALVSLQAELTRRMQLLEGRAKDLSEFVRIAPDEAPPRLVIVVDEFATLVKEVPEFVAGVVDVAQRGRSLGIHLVLATQRPTGSVNDNILANTNLRIGLRMLDGGDSISVLGVPDAANIPVPLRGRALARTGGREMTAFQTAWAGAPKPAVTAERRDVGVERFGFGDVIAASPSRVHVATGADPEVTQLRLAVEAARVGHGSLPRPRRPWLEPLPAMLTLEDLDDRFATSSPYPAGDRGRYVVVGLVDRPSRQSQDAAVIDFDADGGLIVFGTGGSGRTTVLRTIAAELAQQGSPSDVAIVALDGSGRGLRSLTALPHVMGVASVDDPELMTRLIAFLLAELDRRRREFGERGFDSITALRAHGTVPSPPRIVVLVDGYANLTAAFDSPELFGWMTSLQRVVVEGRPLGIHVVLTADRRVTVPAAVTSAISARLTLRMADADAMIDVGVAPAFARTLELDAGRGVLGRDELVQIAMVGDDQTAALIALGDALRRRWKGETVEGPKPLPMSIELASPGSPWRVALGVVDPSGDVFELDVSGVDVTVAGSGGSGRSTAVAHIADSLVRSGVEVIGIGLPGGRTSLADVPGLAARAFDAAGWAEVARRIEDAATGDGRGASCAVVIDDADRIDDPVLASALERAMRLGSVRVIASVDTRVVGGGYQPGWLGELRRSRAMVLLQPASAADVAAIVGRRPVLRPGLAFPPGRGVIATDRVLSVIQLAAPA
jgi:DNA segregation ATPase FtsK/SpoIIIE, S-DNA-T family